MLKSLIPDIRQATGDCETCEFISNNRSKCLSCASESVPGNLYPLYQAVQEVSQC